MEFPKATQQVVFLPVHLLLLLHRSCLSTHPEAWPSLGQSVPLNRTVPKVCYELRILFLKCLLFGGLQKEHVLVIHHSDHTGTYDMSAPGALPANPLRQPLSDLCHHTFIWPVL